MPQISSSASNIQNPRVQSPSSASCTAMCGLKFLAVDPHATSGASILIHSLLYFGLICIFLLAVKVHLYLG
uniref:Uncharacterized protein n=1 Tax=Quercus lobata TaxID=97700 RepID=A0A7N2L7J5_QUELO